jgi:hypothetical protein
MKINSTLDQIKKNGRIVYNDGRPGHKGVLATVLAVDAKGVTVQFDDRADTDYIKFSDRAWMEFIEVVERGIRNPTLDVALRIAKTLKADLPALISEAWPVWTQVVANGFCR